MVNLLMTRPGDQSDIRLRTGTAQSERVSASMRGTIKIPEGRTASNPASLAAVLLFQRLPDDLPTIPR
jgi:hypothetical protein